jgi:hypothetical protein
VNDDFVAEQPNTMVKTIIKKLFFAYLFRERQITEKIIVLKKKIYNPIRTPSSFVITTILTLCFIFHNTSFTISIFV